MRNLSTKAKYGLAAFLILLELFVTKKVLAQDYSKPVAAGEVIVEKPFDISLPYRERRSQFGILFSANYESFIPSKYTSLIQNKKFNDFTGEKNIPVFGAELGVKYNFALGSLAALFGYGKGTVDSPKDKVNEMSVEIIKAGLNLTLDNLMSEPWVAPYGQVNVHRFGWKEVSFDASNLLLEEAFTTDPNISYKVGLLFQLNWLENMIDPNTHVNGLRSSGLENTFLDVFYTMYSAPSEVAEVNGATGEANLESSAFGVGLKLEF